MKGIMFPFPHIKSILRQLLNCRAVDLRIKQLEFSSQ